MIRTTTQTKIFLISSTDAGFYERHVTLLSNDARGKKVDAAVMIHHDYAAFSIFFICCKRFLLKLLFTAFFLNYGKLGIAQISD